MCARFTVFLCSLDILEREGATATHKEILEEEDKFKAIYYVKGGGLGCYGELIKELEQVSHLGHDKYSEKLATDFNVMVC